MDSIDCYKRRIVVRRDGPMVRDRLVAIVSGGSCGHGNTGVYVDEGLLSAVVVRDPEVPPDPDDVIEAICAVTGEPGALLVITDEPKDQDQFEEAIRSARDFGYDIECVRVPETHFGLGGTMLVHKVAGAASAEGRSLPEIKALAEATIAATTKVGVAVDPRVSPITGNVRFALRDEEVLGRIIVAPDGSLRRAAVVSAEELTESMVEELAAKMNTGQGIRLAVLLNDFGLLFFELGLLERCVRNALERRGFEVAWIYSGEFVTSVRAGGLSICLLRADEERLRYLNAKTRSIAWYPEGATDQNAGHAPFEEKSVTMPSGVVFEKGLTAACRAVVMEQARFPELAGVAHAILARLPYLWVDWPEVAFERMAVAMQELLSGTEGALYAAACLRMSSALSADSAWADAVIYSAICAGDLCQVKRGEGTMLDALLPFAKKLQDGGTWAEALAAAKSASVRAEGALVWMTAVVEALG